MKQTCSKCLTLDEIAEHRHEWGETYHFCSICSRVLNDANKTGFHTTFMRDDYGGFPISEVDKNIIDARIARAKGKSPWQKIAK